MGDTPVGDLGPGQRQTRRARAKKAAPGLSATAPRSVPNVSSEPSAASADAALAAEAAAVAAVWDGVERRRPHTPTFPIVGIGASAGGMAAFDAFFSGMPADDDPGLALVVVQHLVPDQPSILAQLVQRLTRMMVLQVEDGMTVFPNCAYIVPPGRDMALLDGRLHLLEPSTTRGQRMPIDFFFRSLAQELGGRAIGVVLSGTGSDGTQGLRSIKTAGGMVIAQSPASAEFDGMPRSAIDAGVVDYELPPAERPAVIIAQAAHLFRGSPGRNPPGG